MVVVYIRIVIEAAARLPWFTCKQSLLADLIFPTWSEVKSLSHVQLFATPWTVAYQAPPSKGFSRQEFWSGLLFPSPGDLPNPGTEPKSPTFQADALTSESPGNDHYQNPLHYQNPPGKATKTQSFKIKL